MINKIVKLNQTNNLPKINPKLFEFVSVEEMKAKEKQGLSGKTQSIWKDIIKRFFRNKWNTFFTIIFALIIASIIIIPLIVKYSPFQYVSKATENSIRLQKPFWVNDWNHIEERISIDKFYKFYNNDGIGFFDKNDVISWKEIANSDGKFSDVQFTYVNKYAIPTILGTDTVGRDVFSRLFYGARWSLSLAISVAVIETIVGISIGVYVGFHVGKFLDTIMMRVVEVFNAVPPLLWLFIFILFAGQSFVSLMLILALVGWVRSVYSARMFTLKIKDAEFIKAAESIGVSKLGRLFRHILPNIFGRLLVTFVHRIPNVIFLETTLVFIGIQVGGQDQLSLGYLIKDAREIDALYLNVYYAIAISSFLVVLIISLQIIANGIRDAFDPKSG